MTLVCAHPAVDPDVRAPLVLQALLGFHAAEIASAFRVRPAAMSQRLVRAKRRLRAAGPGFEPLDDADLAERVAAVLAAVSRALAVEGERGRGERGGAAVHRRVRGRAVAWPGRRAARPGARSKRGEDSA